MCVARFIAFEPQDRFAKDRGMEIYERFEEKKMRGHPSWLQYALVDIQWFESGQ